VDYDVYNLVLDIVESPTDDSLQRRLEEALRAKPGLVRESNPEDGNTFLHLAAQYHHIPAVELLCRHGSDPNARNHSDETSLHHLVKHNPEVGRVSEAPEDVATLQTLLKYGADIHALTSSGTQLCIWPINVRF
jgi:ankyrin repeat protein